MPNTNPVVAIKQGQIRGKTDTDYDGDRYYSFHNIPYAKPPLGELRFKAPQPPESWDGIRDATQEGDECYSMHLAYAQPVGSEDCLILNVFTKELPLSRIHLKPVMVWIHGGGFMAGSSKIEAYGPDFLICEDVVIVSINYRLGVLGFLALDDLSLGVPGNAGLKDMVMALKWVQENIKVFNGDPNNVTIFGESAGGAAVHYLMLSPMAKGLFHKGIAQSGCALNIWAYGTRIGHELAGYLGCTSKNDKDILKVLQNATKEEILKIQNTCRDPFHADDIRPHGPVIEVKSHYEEAFLSELPAKILASGNYNKVPLIMGFNTREGMLFDIMEKRAGKSHKIINFEDAVPHTLRLPKGTPISKIVANEIKNFYYNDEEPSLANIDKYYMLQTDNFFLREINSSIKRHLETSNFPIYYYRFSVESTLNVYKILGNISAKGACHADELGYLFRMFVTPDIKSGTLEDRTIRILSKLWTNFARTGDPNSAQKDKLIPITWLPAKCNEMHFLDIGENLTIGINPEAERMAFWEKIFSLYSYPSKL